LKIVDNSCHLLRVYEYIAIYVFENMSFSDITVVCGSSTDSDTFADGIGGAASFSTLHGVVGRRYQQKNQLFVTDPDHDTIRCIDLETRRVTTAAGHPDRRGSADGKRDSGKLHSPTAIAYAVEADMLYFIDQTGTSLRSYNPVTSSVCTLLTLNECKQLSGATGIAVCSDGSAVYVLCGQPSCILIIQTKGDHHHKVLCGGETSGDTDGKSAQASFSGAQSICLSSDESTLYVSQTTSIRVVDIASASVSTLKCNFSNDDDDVDIEFEYLAGIASTTESIYVADMQNYCVFQIGMQSGEISVACGDPDDPDEMVAPFGLCTNTNHSGSALARVLYVTDGSRVLSCQKSQV
jgi:DNA-binding beta-propeller fold protein YncE